MPSDGNTLASSATPGSAATTSSGQGNRPLKERIAAAKNAARQGRIAAGLPPDADDGPFGDEAMAARRKRAKGRR